MQSNQTTCTRCGIIILKQTAEENHGLCLPCYRKKDGYDFDAKSGDWHKIVDSTLVCVVAGTPDHLDLASKHLADLVIPHPQELIDQGLKFLDEFVSQSKLGEGKWCASSICFPKGGGSFEIIYEGPDFHHYLWTVVFSVNPNSTVHPYWPTEARRTLR